MVTLSLEYILFAVISSAAFASVLLFIIARFFDIQGYRYQLDAQRYAIDLLNLIVSNSPIVERFSDEEPNRIVLSSQNLDEYKWMPWDGCCNSLTVDSNEKRKYWEEHFEILEFEYHLTIEDLINGNSWTISNLYFNETDCYHQTTRVSARAEIPVVISYGKEKHPGKATLILKRTPLSELAFFVSEAFLRGETEEEDYLREVIVDREYIRKVFLNENRICIEVNMNNVFRPLCKYFYRGQKNINLDDRLDDLTQMNSKCVGILVQYSASKNEVSLTL
ncbi:MAG: hypothetical protein QXP77_00095 [Candidatus Aenigmatarchaeota archaeon]